MSTFNSADDGSGESGRAMRDAWADHSRKFSNFKFAYPVISRRARGLSIGINTNPNKVCNFNCAYCQSRSERELTPAEIERQSKAFPSVADLIADLRAILDLYHKNKLADHFPNIPEQNRILQDIALSGDGEPTLYPHFLELAENLLAIQQGLEKNFGETAKLTLITNATQTCEKNKKVVKGLEFLTAKNGEIWGKLDAGSQEWFSLINGVSAPRGFINSQNGFDEGMLNCEQPQSEKKEDKITLSLIENNLKFVVSKFPLKIQTMLCEIQGQVPSESDLQNYAKIVRRIYETNKENLLGVQLYSIIRKTPDNLVKPLPSEFLENAKRILENEINGLTVEAF